MPCLRKRVHEANPINLQLIRQFTYNDVRDSQERGIFLSNYSKSECANHGNRRVCRFQSINTARAWKLPHWSAEFAGDNSSEFTGDEPMRTRISSFDCSIPVNLLATRQFSGDEGANWSVRFVRMDGLGDFSQFTGDEDVNQLV
jgi:hypothetical protein